MIHADNGLMFVRDKTARSHTYLYLVESPCEGSRVRQRTIHALGRKGRVAGQWPRWIG